MKITPVGQHGLQLTHLWLFNCYLVREDDGYTLVDANIKGRAEAILKAAGELPIKRILLTHGHVDHMGSVDALAEKIPGVVVAASERTVPTLKMPPDLSLRPGEADPMRGGFPGMRTRVSHVVNDGERIGSLRAIPTPGHVYGHIAYLDERDGTLYAGDELAGLGGLTITGWSPWWFPLIAYCNRAQARQSAIALLDYPIERFAPGHGAVIAGKPALQAAIANAKL